MKKTMNVRTLTFIAMMGAVSTVLMMLNFSIPFAPSFPGQSISIAQTLGREVGIYLAEQGGKKA